MSETCTESLGQSRIEFGLAPAADKDHGTAAKSRTGQARTQDAVHSGGGLHEAVEFWAGDLEQVPERFVGAGHPSAKPSGPAVQQGVARRERPTDFLDHMLRAAREEGPEGGAPGGERVGKHVAQTGRVRLLLAQDLEGAPALVDALVEQPGGEFAPHTAVSHCEGDVIEVEGQVASTLVLAVEPQQAAGAREPNSKGVHDPAADPHKVALGPQGRAYAQHGVKPKSPDLAQGEGRANADRSR